LTQKLYKNFISSVLTKKEWFLMKAYLGTLFPLMSLIDPSKILSNYSKTSNILIYLDFYILGTKNKHCSCSHRDMHLIAGTQKSTGKPLWRRGAATHCYECWHLPSHMRGKGAGLNIFHLFQIHVGLSNNIRPLSDYWSYFSHGGKMVLVMMGIKNGCLWL
jgi:hypothetical protein